MLWVSDGPAPGNVRGAVDGRWELVPYRHDAPLDSQLRAVRLAPTRVRLLNPLTEERRTFWEVLNYAVALIGLIALGVVWNSWQRNEVSILEAQG